MGHPSRFATIPTSRSASPSSRSHLHCNGNSIRFPNYPPIPTLLRKLKRKSNGKPLQYLVQFIRLDIVTQVN